MRARTNTDANEEASPARMSSVSPADSPCIRSMMTVVVGVLVEVVMVDDIFKFSNYGSDSKG
jgi:hypothetical protein